MYYNEKTAARLINSMISTTKHENLRYAWIDDAGKMCACDGFRAYRLNVPVAGVPDKEADKGINLDRVFPATIDETKALDLPALADVRAMIEEDKRLEKCGERVLYAFTFGQTEEGEQLPAVNLKYLADVLQLFPNARAYYTNTVSPVVFKDENGDAIILPLRIAAMTGVDTTKRRQVPAPVKKDNMPAVGLRTFSALYA